MKPWIFYSTSVVIASVLLLQGIHHELSASQEKVDHGLGLNNNSFTRLSKGQNQHRRAEPMNHATVEATDTTPRDKNNDENPPSPIDESMVAHKYDSWGPEGINVEHLLHFINETYYR